MEGRNGERRRGHLRDSSTTLFFPSFVAGATVVGIGAFVFGAGIRWVTEGVRN